MSRTLVCARGAPAFGAYHEPREGEGSYAVERVLRLVPVILDLAQLLGDVRNVLAHRVVSAHRGQLLHERVALQLEQPLWQRLARQRSSLDLRPPEERRWQAAGSVVAEHLECPIDGLEQPLHRIALAPPQLEHLAVNIVHVEPHPRPRLVRHAHRLDAHSSTARLGAA
eukprot:6588093-Prymnesium_polylepis.1